MHSEKKQGKIYRTAILQMSISTDEKSKVKYIELKYGRFNMQGRRKQSKICRSEIL